MARVLLVGFLDQDNLGLRYLSARLRQSGHDTRIARFGDPGAVVAAVAGYAPDVVGFSLIFQFMTPAFAAAIAAVRRAGYTGHVTLGGHYASFEPAAVLDAAPGLDSIVRYEGEDTLDELVARLAAGLDWRDVHGLAHRDASGAVVCTPAREARTGLDAHPWPDRDDIDYAAMPLPIASVLGSRGCPWKCSFCSIIAFYAQNGTEGRRRRDPLRVVDELEHLHRERGVRVVLFQDDDFLAGGPSANAWAHTLADELCRRGLHEQLRFKISCRSDEVRPAVLAPLVAAGLSHVYLGVESGDAGNLKDLNKLLKPDVHLRAGAVLRDLGVSFDFGFMLLEPWSTRASVRTNLDFLETFVGDGYTVAGWCRTLPYAGTPMEARLRAEGRLRGPAHDADHTFLDPLLDRFYDWALPAFEARNAGVSATWNLLRTLGFDVHLDLPDRPRDPERIELAQRLTALSNDLMVTTLRAALDILELDTSPDDTAAALAFLAHSHAEQDEALRADVRRFRAQRPLRLAPSVRAVA